MCNNNPIAYKYIYTTTSLVHGPFCPLVCVHTTHHFGTKRDWDNTVLLIILSGGP